MALGSLHTNPVTVAITVTTAEEAERMGTTLSQQPAGFISSKRSDRGGDEGSVGGASRADEPYSAYDEESGNVDVQENPRARQHSTTMPSPAAFNRRASFRDGVVPPTPPSSSPASGSGRSTMNRTNSTSVNQRQSVEMGNMKSSGANASNSKGEDSAPAPVDSRKGPPTTPLGREDSRKSLLNSGANTTAERQPLRGSSSSPMRTTK